MKVVILAGGFGTRITDEQKPQPKPMVEIGGRPIIWHIMKYYSSFGHTDFILCLGYMGYAIKEYFANYFLHMCDVTLDLRNNAMEVHNNTAEPWRVTLVDTGYDTMTGGRLRRIKDYVSDGAFLMTYGDGVSDVDIDASIAFHREHGGLATVTAVTPPSRFGSMCIEDRHVVRFTEKPEGEEAWINGGFFVLEPAALETIDGDTTFWEREPLERLAENGQLGAYRHAGFWQCMDTQRDRRHLEEMWASGDIPWKRWD